MTDERTIIPAVPGWTARINGEDRPVVGWAVEDGAFDATPITADSRPGYEVTYVPGVTKVTVPGSYVDSPMGQRQDAIIERGLAERRSQAVPDAAGAPANPGRTTPPAEVSTLVLDDAIPFTGKVYERESNWHHIGTPEFTFTLPPDTPSPKSSLVQKTNREEAAKLKREGVPQYTYALVQNATVRGAGFPVRERIEDPEELEPGTLGGAEITGNDDGEDDDIDMSLV